MSAASPAFHPTLILHGGAIQRPTLPPELYARYHGALLAYLRSTYDQLRRGSSALDAAVHAVSLMEDDELFNCGRGSVFTSDGTIEMEASVMVTSVQPDWEVNGKGAIKRGAGVMLVKSVRHPVLLAREALLRAGYDINGDQTGDGGNMHAQLSGPYVESLARDWNLEFKPDEWFWTKKRWDEHRRGLEGIKEDITMSQGTVGCVCLDQWGNLATATSTGGLTNKKPGRIGDTPTLGAGFWAEAWDIEQIEQPAREERARGMVYPPPSGETQALSRPFSPQEPNSYIRSTTWPSLTPWKLVQDLFFDDCFGTSPSPPDTGSHVPICQRARYEHATPTKRCIPGDLNKPTRAIRRAAVALSGTGNGDSFLRVNAARTASAILRFSSSSTRELDFAQAVTAVAGPGGELQRYAGKRWGKTGEGQGGLIGIGVETDVNDPDYGSDSCEDHSDGCPDEKLKSMKVKGKLQRGKVIFDFNCGGMFRAWIEEDANGVEREKVMVFRNEYR